MTMTDIRHKTIMVKVDFDSHTLHSFMDYEGARLCSAYERVGSLLLLTSSEKEIYKKVSDWQKALHDWLDVQIDSLRKQKEKFVETSHADDSNVILTPSTYNTSINLTHPCMWVLINAIQQVDAEASEIENLWLTGKIDDAARFDSVNRIVNFLRAFNGRIERATAPGKSRSGGHFKAAQLIKMIRGGFELYVNDDDIQKEIERFFSSNAKSIAPVSKPKKQSPQVKAGTAPLDSLSGNEKSKSNVEVKIQKSKPAKPKKQEPAKVEKQEPAKVEKQEPAKVEKQEPAKEAETKTERVESTEAIESDENKTAVNLEIKQAASI